MHKCKPNFILIIILIWLSRCVRSSTAKNQLKELPKDSIMTIILGFLNIDDYFTFIRQTRDFYHHYAPRMPAVMCTQNYFLLTKSTRVIKTMADMQLLCRYVYFFHAVAPLAAPDTTLLFFTGDVPSPSLLATELSQNRARTEHTITEFFRSVVEPAKRKADQSTTMFLPWVYDLLTAQLFFYNVSPDFHGVMFGKTIHLPALLIFSHTERNTFDAVRTSTLRGTQFIIHERSDLSRIIELKWRSQLCVETIRIHFNTAGILLRLVTVTTQPLTGIVWKIRSKCPRGTDIRTFSIDTNASNGFSVFPYNKIITIPFPPADSSSYYPDYVSERSYCELDERTKNIVSLFFDKN